MSSDNPSKHHFSGQVHERLGELDWEFLEQRRLPVYFYTGGRPELIGRTLHIINGPMNTERKEYELEDVMSQCGYW